MDTVLIHWIKKIGVDRSGEEISIRNCRFILLKENNHNELKLFDRVFKDDDDDDSGDCRKRINLYKGLIRPVMTYASEIWIDQINKKQKSKLESMQHQLLRNSIMAFRTVSKACALSLTKITSLETFIEIKKIKFFHKNHLQRIDTENFDMYIKELIRAKILENFENTNQNFKSFFCSKMSQQLELIES
ncbi:hypothetical protein SSS_03037 [Sarcoptes scabiei]|uniref:Uncharacterized protein n=1 Tax=Sarcoptes scabiei TaxID=52283 RepID=A0A834VHX4_SARSC|nr:hypothetical protein SSS_03037 [Sarcoptes scabiei]